MIPAMTSAHSQTTLSVLLAELADVAVADEREVGGLALDSRVVQAGDVFLALAGTREHGLAHADMAVARGAVAIIYEALPGLAVPALAVPAIPVERLGERLGSMASRYYGDPSKQMTVIGVTGTNGKTTCTGILAQALGKLGRRTAMIGTTGSGEWGRLTPATHTTPDAISLQRQLAGFQASGINTVAMEVSSHALQQGRTNGTEFDVAVFTNLSHEHLDYHGSMQEYARAKARLFRDGPLQLAVINNEDDAGIELLTGGVNAASVVSYGLASGDVHATGLTLQEYGLRMQVRSPWGDLEINSTLLGRFNAANLLACAAALLGSGWPVADVASALSSVQPAAGRMECFRGDGITLVVDFAHTPDALEQALLALREHIKGGRLWCVFGCGGERDAAKRALMGAAAERHADHVIVTDDNPRHEDPQSIRSQVLAGMTVPGREIADRRMAIEAACDEAEAGDIILLAGKGHELTQQIGDLKLPFSDRELAGRLTRSEVS